VLLLSWFDGLIKAIVENGPVLYTTNMTELPLGISTTHPEEYSPASLRSIPRKDSRARLGLPDALPFDGVDIWNAWELTWLNSNGQPQVATAELRVPADSPGIVESKSMKLYLGSFAMSRYPNAAEVRELIASDVGDCVGSPITVRLDALTATEGRCSQRMPGVPLDRHETDCNAWDVDADLLTADRESIVTEELFSDLLRSLCPVTGQPDSGSILICYEGPHIDRQSLLRYIVSYRRHQDFHENCIERMFVDILERCEAQKLSVYARYQRRGGIDINPFRSNFEKAPRNLRLWRQ
jgi:7-cyano-7-deazaguanine reductase